MGFFDENKNDDSVETVLQTSNFAEFILPCEIGCPTCTHPEKTGIVTIKSPVKQLNTCQSCYNFMVENKKWIVSSWN